MTLLLLVSTAARADDYYRPRHYRGFSYPSVTQYSRYAPHSYGHRYGGRFDHPYYRGISVAGPIHPIYGYIGYQGSPYVHPSHYYDHGGYDSGISLDLSGLLGRILSRCR